MKLLAFVPCEKVILNKEDNNSTLITVLTEIAGEYQLVPGAKQERADTFPYQWSIFTMWQFEPDETTRTFIQLVKFKSPSGEYLQSGRYIPIPFLADKPIHRIVSRVQAIPIGEPGQWEIELFAAEEGSPFPDEPIATYPLRIHFTESAKPIA